MGASLNATPQPIKKVIATLSKPVPRNLLKTKRLGGKAIQFLPWYRAVLLLNAATDGLWNYKVSDILTTEDRIFVVASITITAKEGQFTREATGTEMLEVRGYGDPSSNAESMALRRAAAKFGLCLDLYDEG